MRVFIYGGGLRLVGKSGVGQAIFYQREMLRRARIDTADHWCQRAGAVHINTVLPDSVLAALAEDIAAGSWGSPSWSKNEEDRYVVSLEIRYIRTGGWTEDREEDRARNDTVTIILRPEMTHTVETLLELGLTAE